MKAATRILGLLVIAAGITINCHVALLRADDANHGFGKHHASSNDSNDTLEAIARDPIPSQLGPRAQQLDCTSIGFSIGGTDYTCGIVDTLTTNECRWNDVFYPHGGLLNPDPVEARMKALGVYLDGNLADSLGPEYVCVTPPAAGLYDEGEEGVLAMIAPRGVGHIDRIGSTQGAPGPDGSEDGPYYQFRPSGFQVACGVLWFEPDHDPHDGLDTSFLYIAWEIPSNATTKPRPFDVDYDGSACVFSNEDDNEGTLESYDVRLLAGVDPTTHDPTSEDTHSLDSGGFVVTYSLEIREQGAPDEQMVLRIRQAQRLGVPAITNMETLSFPTSYNTHSAYPDPVINPANACIDREMDACAVGRCYESAAVCTSDADCGAGDSCSLDTNNVELVLKAVETSGAFGPHTAECDGAGHNRCKYDSDCPAGQACVLDIPADSWKARENRFALAQIAALLTATSYADISPEDRIVVAALSLLPELEVSKQVRCITDTTPDPVFGTTSGFSTHVEALPGSLLEFKITVTNTGNQLLDVTVEDILKAVDDQQATLGLSVCTQVPSPYIRAYLSSPRRQLDDASWIEPLLITPSIANNPPVCAAPDATNCLEPAFFQSCTPPAASFLQAIDGNDVVMLGGLMGVKAMPLASGNQSSELIPGDTLEIYYRAIVDVNDESSFCENRLEIDATNSVSITGSSPGNPTILASDIADDDPETYTYSETLLGHDDNTVSIDVLCRGITLEKTVKLDEAGQVFVSTLGIETPFDTPTKTIIYRYDLDNTTGETDEAVTLTDEHLCEDINAIAGVSIPAGGDPRGICDSNGIIHVVVPKETSSPYELKVKFDDEAAFRLFLERDDLRANCTAGNSANAKKKRYKNCANITANATNIDNICDGAGPLTGESAAEIRESTCDINVEKRVRCVDGCTTNPVGLSGWYDDSMDAIPGSFVQFEIEVTNSGDKPIYFLKFVDLMVPPTDIQFKPGSVKLELNGTPFTCTAFQNAFNVITNDTVMDLVSCTGSTFDPEDVLSVRFCAEIPATADPSNTLPPPPFFDVVNQITVEADCDDVQDFDPVVSDEDDVAIDILPVDLECQGKTWEYQVDEDCDGVWDEAYTTPASSIDLTGLIFPVQLRMCITAKNTGQVPLEVTATDTDFIADIGTIADIILHSCELTTPKLVLPNFTATWCCEVEIKTAEAMRDLAKLDGIDDLIYNNTATVEGTPVSGGLDICIPPNADKPDDTCSATIIAPDECQLTITKQVACATTNPQYGSHAEGVPGSTFTFRIEVTNTSANAKFAGLRVHDTLACMGWYNDTSAKVFLRGADVTGDLGFSPVPAGYTFEFKNVSSGDPWMNPGDSLVITFDIVVPADTYTSCTNKAQAFAQVDCGGLVDGCGTAQVEAQVNILRPDVSCVKKVCLDIDTNGECDDEYPFSSDTAADADGIEFPLYIIYQYGARNTGEVDLAEVTVCDGQILDDAQAAGLSVVSCDLDANGCLAFGDISTHGVSTNGTCTLKVPDLAAWRALTLLDLDGSSDCYQNRAEVTAMTAPQDNVCGGDPFPVAPSMCYSLLCMGNPCNRCCPPLTKAKILIWNENEVKFSGTEKCICSHDESLISNYTDYNIGNSFLRIHLQTDKGKGRIYNMPSQVVCPADEYGQESIEAPLLGIMSQILEFHDVGHTDRTGAALIAAGAQPGHVYYTPGGAPPQYTPLAPDDNGSGDPTLHRASASKKGSLLAFLKVQARYDAQMNIIEDTFVSLVNDYNEPVGVQLYLVSSETCKFVDNAFTLTGNQPYYWSAATGQMIDGHTGQPIGIVSPLSVLEEDTVCSDDLPDNPNGFIRHGYLLVWAVDQVTNEEVHWNHLSGSATVVNYQAGGAWRYPAWAFAAVDEVEVPGQILHHPLGELDLDGVEYDNPPSQLVFDFFAAGATFNFSALDPPRNISTDTELILWVAEKDLRNESDHVDEQ